MKKFFLCITAIAALMMLADAAMAQQPRGRGGGGFGGFGGSDPLSLTRNASIRKEVEIEEDQVAEINKIQEAMNAELRTVQDEVRTKYAKKLDGVLLPHQTKRLQEISLQLRGLTALTDADVAKQLGLSESQSKRITEVRAANTAKFREAFQGGNRPSREDFQKLREEGDAAVLGVLSSSQRSAYEKLKGKPIDREQLFPRRGRGGGGQGGNNPQRKRPAGKKT